MPRKTEPKRVLLARFSALGDVAMTVPVVYSACRCYPDVEFLMLTRPSMTGIFVDPPANLKLFGADIKGEFEGLSGLRRLSNKLFQEFHPDVFVDLHNVIRTRVIGAFLKLRGVECRHLEKPRMQRKALTRRRNKILLPLRGQRELYRDTFARAGLPVTPCFEGLFEGHATAPASLFAAICSPKPPKQKWIGIAPFAAHPGKVYPVELMEKVIIRLKELADSGKDLRVFLFGGGEEESDILGGWAARYAVATSLAGKKYGFAAELALLNHLDVMLSMDSANMHLAAIAGTPTLSLWGATHPYCGFTGWRQNPETTIQAPLECRPCSVFGNKPCFRGDYQCLRAIKPEVVYQRIVNELK